MVNIDRDGRRTQRFQNVDFNVNRRQMEVLLEAAARRGERGVRELAKTILDAGVIKVTGAHAGGLGNADREADPLQHCTVRDGNRNNYHVYLGEKNGASFIVNITA